jgi:hypothetical protein
VKCALVWDRFDGNKRNLPRVLQQTSRMRYEVPETESLSKKQIKLNRGPVCCYGFFCALVNETMRLLDPREASVIGGHVGYYLFGLQQCTVQRPKLIKLCFMNNVASSADYIWWGITVHFKHKQVETFITITVAARSKA